MHLTWSTTGYEVALAIILGCVATFILYPMIVGLVFVSTGLSVKSRWELLKIIFFCLFLLIVAIFFLGDATLMVGPFLARSYLWLMATFGLKATQLVIGVTVVVIGFGAFFFKSRHQTAYGAVEVTFAWVAAIIAARQMKPRADWSGQIATLIGAIYIVSRGLGNAKDGLKKNNGRPALNDSPEASPSFPAPLP
jgi:hypothetical protein